MPRIGKWYADATYVVHGTARDERGLKSLSEGMNGDIWTGLSALLDSKLPAADKIKAHSSVDDVRSGRMTWEQYLGNNLADAAAGAAAARAIPYGIVLEELERQERLGFHICMRLCAVEALVELCCSQPCFLRGP